MDNDKMTGYLAGKSDGGGNGFGFGGGGRCAYATQADLAAGINNSAVLNKLNDITVGQANAINYNNQGFSGLNTSLLQGFHGVDNAVCTLGYQTQTGFANLGAQLAQCCCDVEKMNLQNRFDAQNNTNNTLLAIDKLGDKILGYMANQETQKLRDEVQAYRLSASQAAQNQYLINELRPCPRPAYITCNPYAASLGFGGNPCGRDCGYGYAA